MAACSLHTRNAGNAMAFASVDCATRRVSWEVITLFHAVLSLEMPVE